MPSKKLRSVEIAVATKTAAADMSPPASATPVPPAAPASTPATATTVAPTPSATPAPPAPAVTTPTPATPTRHACVRVPGQEQPVCGELISIDADAEDA